ncbi:MAG TPA: G1 family glutamic endopeptidase [Streptosporangiaceae bacterium]|jgi:peptidase A4-like protein
MLRRWCIPLAGLGLVLGSVIAAAGPAAAAPAARHSSLIRPAVHLVRPTGHGTRPLAGHGGRVNAASSTNWSGYAATGRTFTSVSASWTEPTGTCSGSAKYSSFWVGLDGYNSSSVEQTGSEVDCSGSTPEYYSWYEMYPAYPVNFSNTVRPGDHFQGSVTYNGSGNYTLVLSDTTRGWSHTVHASLSGAANSSAEVIAEAPCCTASGGILPLAHFSPVTFTNATANGSAIGSFSPTQIIMVNNSGQAKDSISSLSGGNSFTATWLRAN